MGSVQRWARDTATTNQSVEDPRRRYDQRHVHDHVYGGRSVYGEVGHAVELYGDVGYDAVLYPVHRVGHRVQHVHEKYHPPELVQLQALLLFSLLLVHHRPPDVNRVGLLWLLRSVHFLHHRSKIGHRYAGGGARQHSEARAIVSHQSVRGSARILFATAAVL